MSKKVEDASAEEKAELGTQVAGLKALLHDVENSISEHRMGVVDWIALASKLQILGVFIHSLKATPAPPPPATSPTPPRPPLGKPRLR